MNNKFNFTDLAIKALAINCIVVSIATLQWALGWNMFTFLNMEASAKGLFVSFQLICILLFCISLLSELSDLNTKLKSK